MTRYGGGEIGTRRARAAVVLLMALPGGAYVYQGEELGLPEVKDLPDEVRQDPTFYRTQGADVGRDGCRVPLPWSGKASPFGFGPPGSTPWLPQPARWSDLSVEREQADGTSMLALYRRVLKLRRELPALGDGDLTWFAVGPDALAFRREAGFLCVVNCGQRPLELTNDSLAGASLVLTSDELTSDRVLPPDTAAWYVDDQQG